MLPVSDATNLACVALRDFFFASGGGGVVSHCIELGPVSLLRNDAKQSPRLMWEYFSGVVVACCLLRGSWHKVANVACW